MFGIDYERYILNKAVQMKMDDADDRTMLIFYGQHGIPEQSVLSLKKPLAQLLDRALSKSMLSHDMENFYFLDNTSQNYKSAEDYFKNVVFAFSDVFGLIRPETKYSEELKIRAECYFRKILVGAKALEETKADIFFTAAHESAHHFHNEKLLWTWDIENYGLIPFNTEHSIDGRNPKIGELYSRQPQELHCDTIAEVLRRSAHLMVRGEPSFNAIENVWKEMHNPHRQNRITHCEGRIYPALLPK